MPPFLFAVCPTNFKCLGNFGMFLSAGSFVSSKQYKEGMPWLEKSSSCILWEILFVRCPIWFVHKDPRPRTLLEI